MKRYLCFSFDTYYPAGGFNDFKYAFDTVEEADEWLMQNSSACFDGECGVAHYIDSTNPNIIAKQICFDCEADSMDKDIVEENVPVKRDWYDR